MSRACSVSVSVSVLLCGRKRLSSSVLLSVWSALIWNGIGDGIDDFGL